MQCAFSVAFPFLRTHEFVDSLLCRQRSVVVNVSMCIEAYMDYLLAPQQCGWNFWRRSAASNASLLVFIVTHENQLGLVSLHFCSSNTLPCSFAWLLVACAPLVSASGVSSLDAFSSGVTVARDTCGLGKHYWRREELLACILCLTFIFLYLMWVWFSSMSWCGVTTASFLWLP